MPGVLKVEGTNIATGDGNGAVTINNATLGSDSVHTYTINDNDDAPVVDFNSTSSSGAE